MRNITFPGIKALTIQIYDDDNTVKLVIITASGKERIISIESFTDHLSIIEIQR